MQTLSAIYNKPQGQKSTAASLVVVKIKWFLVQLP